MAILVLSEQEVTDSKIIIPTKAKEDQAPAFGKIIAKGPQVPDDISLDVKVCFDQFAGHDIALEDKMYRVVREESISLILE